MNNQETPNPKCNSCKCYWKPNEGDIKSSGLYCKTCTKCRDYKSKYFEKNIEKYNTFIVCGCGNHYYKRHYKRHLTNQRHKDWLENPEKHLESLKKKIENLIENPEKDLESLEKWENIEPLI